MSNPPLSSASDVCAALRKLRSAMARGTITLQDQLHALRVLEDELCKEPERPSVCCDFAKDGTIITVALADAGSEDANEIAFNRWRNKHPAWCLLSVGQVYNFKWSTDLPPGKIRTTKGGVCRILDTPPASEKNTRHYNPSP